MKTLSKIILLSFLSFFCLAQVSIAEECKDDPDQCTPKKLCDISTEMVNGLKFWTSNLDFDEHVNFAKEIGIDCGASDPKSACDLDANECKISELCEKATINEGDDVSWNPKAEGHVHLAKEYGLSCNVQKDSSSVIKRSSQFANWSDETICWYLQKKNEAVHLKEAERRGLDCEIMNELANYKKEDKQKDKVDLRQSFISEPILKRQQIQYALSKLGYYDVRVSVVGSEQVFDGKWSIGTRLALKTFASKEGLDTEKPKTIFSNLLNKVSVPSSFVKKEQSENHSHTKKQNQSGWRSLNRNPKFSFDEAKGICAAKAEERSYLSSNRQQESSSGINCRSTGSKSFSCTERRNNNYSGDMKDNILAGILNGLTEGLERSRAKKVFEKACMADYGWIKR